MVGGSWKGAGGACEIEAVNVVTVVRGSTWRFVCLYTCMYFSRDVCVQGPSGFSKPRFCGKVCM